MRSSPTAPAAEPLNEVTMYLSDDQMAVVSGTSIQNWEEVELPVGRQPLPAWVAGAHVDWKNGRVNSPDVLLKLRGKNFDWPDKRWAKEADGIYIARHADGRAEVMYHRGAISMVELKDERQLSAGVKPSDLATVKVRATTQQDGFAGRHYWLMMEDGEPLVLRGPWHGGAPAGYVEVLTVDMDTSWNRDYRWYQGRPWFKRGACFGLYITEDLFLRIVAHYAAHARVARVVHSYGPRLDLYRAEWGMPKEFIYELERGRAVRKEPAGEFWRVYWDNHEGYCGSLRIPTYGFRHEVTDLPTAADHELANRRPW